MKPARSLFTLVLLGLLVEAAACSGSSKTESALPTIAQRSRTSAGAAVLYSFKGGKDGANPYAGLVAFKGVLYGTTGQGGSASGNGTVFAISPTGKERVLYRFKGGADGMQPFAGLIAVKGTLYGTTKYGGGSHACGTYGCGTVFALSTSGKERVVYGFKGGKDGAEPTASLVAVKGTLYGTTSAGGGASGNGTVFAISAAGKERVVYRFKGGADGADPEAGLIAVNGLLYGTTRSGGIGNSSAANGNGTVFRVSTSGKELVLHTFTGSGYNPDGAQPVGNLINVNGTLYGTTTEGVGIPGSPGCCGTVFQITTSGTESVLYHFTGQPNDGASPWAGLIAANGALYGTTDHGGLNDLGTVFEVSTTGSASILYSFHGSYGSGFDGLNPVAGLAALNGSFYGTTQSGGATGNGTVFRL